MGDTRGLFNRTFVDGAGDLRDEEATAAPELVDSEEEDLYIWVFG